MEQQQFDTYGTNQQVTTYENNEIGTLLFALWNLNNADILFLPDAGEYRTN